MACFFHVCQPYQTPMLALIIMEKNRQISAHDPQNGNFIDNPHLIWTHILQFTTYVKHDTVEWVNDFLYVSFVFFSRIRL